MRRSFLLPSFAPRNAPSFSNNTMNSSFWSNTKMTSVSPQTMFFRSFASQIIYKDELRNLLNRKAKDYVLVDVREPYELLQEGKLPNSVNIPLAQLEKDLQLPEYDFVSKYGIDQIDPDQQVIFSCRAGVRAERACEIASKLGFNNVRNYKGSAKEWFQLPDQAPPKRV
eukprot:TRINITY_DN2031_c0_g1_i1.p1 TRINITY_DN2031_c0_g1~~TRINITY_DN2031_c0_g1_i1.p1  ORF type:complete len:169 (-),score=32.09 TRINITY_DN2031_c0_g1_i1:29-535(-)